MTSKLQRAFALLVVAACVSGRPSTVEAAPGSETAALKQFEEGKKAFDAGQFEHALTSFQGSLQLLPSPNTRLYIARCYRAMGKWASAFTSYRLSSREATDRLGSTGEKRYKATRDASAAEAAEIEPRVPRITIAVPSDVGEGFVVKLDDGELPKGAWGTAIEVDPGAHVVIASGRRRRPFRQEMSVKDGEQVRVAVESPRLPTGSLAITFRNRPSGVALELDGEPVDPTSTNVAQEVDAGGHKLVARAPGYKDFVWTGQVADGDRSAVEIGLEEDATALGGKGTPKWLFFTAAGVGVVGVGIGTLFAVQAQGVADDEKAKDPLLRDPARKDDVSKKSVLANVGFVVGGVSLVGAGVLLFTTKWSAEKAAEPSATRITPWLGPGGAGLAAEGRF